jgi:hypothetical protein
VGTQSVCHSPIGARPHVGLSIGARLYLLLVNNKLRTCVVLSPCTSPVMRLRLVSAELLVLVRWRYIHCSEPPLQPFWNCDVPPQSFYGDGMGQGTKYGLKETIQEGVVSGYVSYPVRKRTTRREKEEKTCTTFPDVAP